MVKRVPSLIGGRSTCQAGLVSQTAFKRAGLPVTSAVFGLWAFSTHAEALTPEDAAGHIGETATGCGVVVSGDYEPNEQSQPTLLDLGKPYPNAIFTALIYAMDRA